MQFIREVVNQEVIKSHYRAELAPTSRKEEENENLWASLESKISVDASFQLKVLCREEDGCRKQVPGF